MTQCLVIYERADDGGWGAYLPDLPGVVALGRSQDEAAKRMREALGAYVEEMATLGQALPAPIAVAEKVRVG